MSTTHMILYTILFEKQIGVQFNVIQLLNPGVLIDNAAKWKSYDQILFIQSLTYDVNV